MDWKLVCGLVTIVVMVWAVVRQVDVRLALFGAALVLGTLAGDPAAIVRKFLVTLSSEQYVIPLCTAMGFARVLQHTQCDQHLIQLLVTPLRRVRVLLIPGGVLVGFLVNMPVISQTSTAVAVGTVIVPVMLAGGVSPATTGAALLLGASLGGELLNPGAPELRTVATTLDVQTEVCIRRVIPLVFVQLGVATAAFWALSLRVEAQFQASKAAQPTSEPLGEGFRVNLLKAAVPLLPLVLLFLTFRGFGVLSVPTGWLADERDASTFDSRLIGAAMLVGVLAAMLTSPQSVPGVPRAFFEGAGYALANIVSLIVTASCFGEGVKLIGLASHVSALIGAQPLLLLSSAGALPLAFGALSGSGMAATQSLFELFVAPSRELGIDPVHVGAVVSIGAAAGRTMSPVAAVTLMSASLTETSPFTLARLVAAPLLIGMVAVVATAIWIAD
jgi:C4-dicarboxylate transporter, DcuC family